MIKKHLIACSVLLAGMIGGKMLLKSEPVRRHSWPVQARVPEEIPPEDDLSSSLSFAAKGLPMQDPAVAKRLQRTLREYRFEHLQSDLLHKKAEAWFPIIEPILKEYGIPDDFKYIPLVESGLKQGVSPKGAAGYWQFMPQTARVYGLTVNERVDERLNVRKSTVAACKYLRSLYGEFKDWTLVAAGYNLGENKLWAAIRQQKHRDYFRLKLNSETASYVYKLVAMKEVVENPSLYGYSNGKRNWLANEEIPTTRYNYFNPQVAHSTFSSAMLYRQ